MNATGALTARWVASRRLEQLAFGALLAFVAALQVSIAAASIMLTVVLLAWFTSVVVAQERVEVPMFFWPLAAYGGWTLISALFSGNPVASLVDSKQLVLLLIVPMVYRLGRDDRAVTVIDVIISVGAITALVGIVQYGILHYDNLGKRPQGTLTHYMTYSGVLMLVIAAAAARLLFDVRNRLWTLLVMPALLVALSLTFSRSAWLGSCAMFVLLAVMKDRRLLVLAPLVGVLIIAVAPASITNRMYSTFDMNDPTIRDRFAMIREGVHMIRDHPLTGVGPDQIKAVYTQYLDPMAVEPMNFHLHNVIVQIGAERGLPALIIWLVFVAVVLRDCWGRFRRGRHPAIAATGVAAMVAMLAAGMAEWNFGDSEFLMLLLVLITLAASADREPLPEAPA